MSAGMPQDWNETKKQILEPDLCIKDKTWLRHSVNAQSGQIDIMLLKGTYRIEDMVSELYHLGLFNKNHDSYQCRKRVLDHLNHLQDGDSRNRASGTKPHNLKLKEVGGKWMFNMK